ncbi:Intercellular adhesion protein R [Cedecea lapagei]|uniref:Intercellular adhesion protein R n=1 Tax=Cedecea lapagei TaxID=158823 RepID=A0A447V278_9ENTR|nr:TetR/AcrR family transcriptional regulator [Cedecea lapagei]VEB97618.1 Intercellular adhesion protein R [Cedecea lapagei]
MARPKQLDRDKALDAAKRLFWQRGYAGVSADDLIKEMGIARQSLYDNFGSKRALYLEALRSYNTGNVGALIQLLREEKSVRETLKRLLLAPAQLSQEEREMGCFNVSSLSEFGLADPEVLAASEGSRVAANAAIESLIDEGKRNGELPAHLNTRVASNYIACISAGLKVSSRAGASSDMLREIGEMALTAITGGDLPA